MLLQCLARRTTRNTLAMRKAENVPPSPLPPSRPSSMRDTTTMQASKTLKRSSKYLASPRPTHFNSISAKNSTVKNTFTAFRPLSKAGGMLWCSTASATVLQKIAKAMVRMKSRVFVKCSTGALMCLLNHCCQRVSRGHRKSCMRSKYVHRRRSSAELDSSRSHRVSLRYLGAAGWSRRRCT